MPVEISCDECGNEIVGRYNNSGVLFCENCFQEAKNELEEFQDTVQNLQEEVKVWEDDYSILEDDLNAALAEIERLKND